MQKCMLRVCVLLFGCFICFGCNVFLYAQPVNEVVTSEESTEQLARKQLQEVIVLDYCAVAKRRYREDKDQILVTEYKGQIIGFWCPHCIKEFDKNPELYWKKLLDEKAKGNVKIYPAGE